MTINDIITTDGYLDIVKNYSEKLCHIKTDYFRIGTFQWRGGRHPNIIKENVIISHSDYPVTNDISKKFKRVFCVNNDSTSVNTYSLPLGIPNNTDELEILKIIGNKHDLISLINCDLEKQNLLYINFSIDTQKNIREPLYKKFENNSWILKEYPSYDVESRKHYLENIKKSKFVLCPRGNGYDTHRLWESLYLNAIPIIQYHRTHDICEDLPVLFVNDWNEITEEYLNEKYYEILNKKFNKNKLKLSYWDNFIKNNL